MPKTCLAGRRTILTMPTEALSGLPLLKSHVPPGHPSAYTVSYSGPKHRIFMSSVPLTEMFSPPLLTCFTQTAACLSTEESLLTSHVHHTVFNVSSPGTVYLLHSTYYSHSLALTHTMVGSWFWFWFWFCSLSYNVSSQRTQTMLISVHPGQCGAG